MSEGKLYNQADRMNLFAMLQAVITSLWTSRGNIWRRPLSRSPLGAVPRESTQDSNFLLFSITACSDQNTGTRK